MRILEIDPEARRMSLSIRKASEAAPVAAATAAPAAEPAKKSNKKRPPLKGGLDWNW